MLILISRITIIKNISTNTPGKTPVISNNFTIPYYNSYSNTVNPKTQAEIFNNIYKQGLDIALQFNYVNDIQITSNFKDLNKTCKIKFPRKLNFDGINLFKTPTVLTYGPATIFGRGDRIIIELGYVNDFDYYYDNLSKQFIESEFGKQFYPLKTLFKGYITRVGINTPIELECMDQMFGLQQIRTKYPTINDNGKTTLINLLSRLFDSGKNSNNNNGPNYQFDLNPSPIFGINSATFQRNDNVIPVIMPNGLNTGLFTYNTQKEKSIAEILVDLKSKLGLISYFDDFGNLHIELPFMNSNLITNVTQLVFEKQLINYDNMRLINANETPIKIIFSSKSSIPGTPNKDNTLYANNPNENLKYVGDSYGNSITVNGPNDLSQTDLDNYAQILLQAYKYTGYEKGSSFTTFGEPAIHIGQGVYLASIDNALTERGGYYFVTGVNRSFGVDGYKQTIEVGISLGNNPSNFTIINPNKIIKTYSI